MRQCNRAENREIAGFKSDSLLRREDGSAVEIATAESLAKSVAIPDQGDFASLDAGCLTHSRTDHRF